MENTLRLHYKDNMTITVYGNGSTQAKFGDLEC
jgi:hypothetical protein